MLHVSFAPDFQPRLHQRSVKSPNTNQSPANASFPSKHGRKVRQRIYGVLLTIRARRFEKYIHEV